MSKPDVQKVTAEIEPPKGDDPGQATFGYFIVKNNLLTMTDGDGRPIRKSDGESYRHKLGPKDNPSSIARVLTKQIRRAIHGGSNFNRPLRYPNSWDGVA